MPDSPAGQSFSADEYDLSDPEGVIGYLSAVSSVLTNFSEYLLRERRPSPGSLDWIINVMLGYRTAVQERAPTVARPPHPLKSFLRNQAKLMNLWHEAYWALDEYAQLVNELYPKTLDQPQLVDERVKALSRARRTAHARFQSFRNMHLAKMHSIQLMIQEGNW